MQPYFYKAICTRVIDGDTAVVNLDVGFGFKTIQTMRFLEVNTPERYALGYEEATQFTSEKILGKEILINTTEKDAFGRWLANIYYKENDQYVNLNQELINNKLASVYKK